MSGILSKVFLGLFVIFYLNVAVAENLSVSSPSTLNSSISSGQAPNTVDINLATAEEIAEKLNGIGLAKARLIVAFREEHGKFTSIEELEKVKGIGPKLIERNRDKILISQ